MEKEKLEANILNYNTQSPNIQGQMRKIQDAANKTIFRPIVKKPGRFELWLKKKMVSYLNKRDPYYNRFMVIHHNNKTKILHRFLRLGLGINLNTWLLNPVYAWFKRRMKDYLIKGLDDIPAEPHNNHLRIFYWCWLKSLDQFWTKFVYCLPGRVDKKRFPTEQIYLDSLKNSKMSFQDRDSHARRKLLIDLWMTEITEDTADREWLNMFLLNIYHQVHQYYGGKVPYPGDQPMYDSGGPHNPKYFLWWDSQKLWHPPESKERIEEEL